MPAKQSLSLRNLPQDMRLRFIFFAVTQLTPVVAIGLGRDWRDCFSVDSAEGRS